MIWTCEHTTRKLEHPNESNYLSVWHSQPVSDSYNEGHFFPVKEETLALWILSGWVLLWEDE